MNDKLRAIHDLAAHLHAVAAAEGVTYLDAREAAELEAAGEFAMRGSCLVLPVAAWCRGSTALRGYADVMPAHGNALRVSFAPYASYEAS